MMKYKIITVVLLISVILVTVSCSSDYLQQTKETTTQVTHQQITEEYSDEIAKQTVEETANIELTQQEDIGGAVLGLNKYRTRYYDVPAPFIYLVGKEEYTKWEAEQPYPNNSNVMMMVNFVQDFNISREDFDKANSESAWRIKYLLDGVPVMNPQDYANQEDDEVYNADIIYSFDNELINEYYLSHDYPYWYADEYLEAVENGTYETRTTDFVTVPTEQPMPESMDQKFVEEWLGKSDSVNNEHNETEVTFPTEV